MAQNTLAQIQCTVRNIYRKSIYSHSSLQGAIVKPGLRQIIPLMPEENHNTDGSKKQDCEMNAGKRFIHQDFLRLKITIGGDGLYSKQPIIIMLIEEGMNFILVAKPDDHTVLMKEFEKLAVQLKHS